MLYKKVFFFFKYKIRLILLVVVFSNFLYDINSKYFCFLELVVLGYVFIVWIWFGFF